MKVLEEHKPQDERLGRFRCPNCKSVFLTEPEDIARMKMTRAQDDYGPWKSEYWSIDCPVCGYSVDLLYPEFDIG